MRNENKQTSFGYWILSIKSDYSTCFHVKDWTCTRDCWSEDMLVEIHISEMCLQLNGDVIPKTICKCDHNVTISTQPNWILLFVAENMESLSEYMAQFVHLESIISLQIKWGVHGSTFSWALQGTHPELLWPYAILEHFLIFPWSL